MEHPLDPCHCVVDLARVCHAASEEMATFPDRAQVLAPAGAEVIEDANRMTPGKQALHQVGAEEATTARDQTTRHEAPPGCVRFQPAPPRTKRKHQGSSFATKHANLSIVHQNPRTIRPVTARRHSINQRSYSPAALPCPLAVVQDAHPGSWRRPRPSPSRSEKDTIPQSARSPP